MSNIIKFKKRRISKGIILSGTTVNNETGVVAKDLSLQDLMFYGLYWDNVILTQIPMIETSSPEIEQLLVHHFHVLHLQFYTESFLVCIGICKFIIFQFRVDL